MIDRYRKWKITHANESDSDSDTSDANAANDSDSEWDIGTIKEPPTSFIEPSTPFEDNDDLSRVNGSSNGTTTVTEDSGLADRVAEQALAAAAIVNARNNSRSTSPVKSRVEMQQQQRRSSKESSPLKNSRDMTKSDLNLVRNIKTLF